MFQVRDASVTIGPGPGPVGGGLGGLGGHSGHGGALRLRFGPRLEVTIFGDAVR